MKKKNYKKSEPTVFSIKIILLFSFNNPSTARQIENNKHTQLEKVTLFFNQQIRVCAELAC